MKEGGLLTHYIRDDNKIERPYIVCHMLTSIDGKVTGKFLSEPKHINIIYMKNFVL